MRKRILAVFVLLLVLLSQTAVYAAAGALSADPVSAKPGEQVRIAVKLQNPGIVATRIFVDYNSSSLRLDKAENGDVFDKSTAVFGGDTSKVPFILLWDDSLRTDNNTKSGTLCFLTFTVLPGASGEKANVRFTVDKNSTFDVDLNEVSVSDATVEVRFSGSGSGNTTAAEKPADTTKAGDTTRTAVTTKAADAPKTTAKSGDASKTTKAADATKAPSAIKADAANATTARSASITKPTTDATTKAAASGNAKTTKAAAADATKASLTAPKTPSTAKETASTAKSGDTTAAGTTAPTPGTAAALPDGTPTVPDTLAPEADVEDSEYVPNFAEPLPHTDEESSTETLLIDPVPPQKSGKQLLWLLVLIPVAAVVVVIVLKKKKA